MNKTFEAREFLLKAKTDLAKNRFSSKKEAIDFVELLYTLGAPQVTITGIRSFISEDEMSCDKLIVKLPYDDKRRQDIFGIYNKGLLDEGFEHEEDRGQN